MSAREAKRQNTGVLGYVIAVAYNGPSHTLGRTPGRTRAHSPPRPGGLAGAWLAGAVEAERRWIGVP